MGVIVTVGVAVGISVGTDVVDEGICVGVATGWIAVGDGDKIVDAGETAVAAGSQAHTRASRAKRMAAFPIDLTIVRLPLRLTGACPKGPSD